MYSEMTTTPTTVARQPLFEECTFQSITSKEICKNFDQNNLKAAINLVAHYMRKNKVSSLQTSCPGNSGKNVRFFVDLTKMKDENPEKYGKASTITLDDVIHVESDECPGIVMLRQNYVRQTLQKKGDPQLLN